MLASLLQLALSNSRPRAHPFECVDLVVATQPGAKVACKACLGSRQLASRVGQPHGPHEVHGAEATLQEADMLHLTVAGGLRNPKRSCPRLSQHGPDEPMLALPRMARASKSAVDHLSKGISMLFRLWMQNSQGTTFASLLL